MTHSPDEVPQKMSPRRGLFRRTGLAALAALAAFASPALAAGGEVPPLAMALPFVVVLLCIALLPLIAATEHWWHKNKSKLIVSAVMGLVTLTYYFIAQGMSGVGTVLQHAVLDEYIPFMALLFSLYTIAGGIELSGDLKAHPRTNVTFIAVGALIASFVGTTGAAMLLIRPLLRTNRERKHVVHTVIFFIFAVCNCGGLLLPIGDPPLFLGYLKGVPFTWTMQLWPEFLVVNGMLLATYFVWDMRAYKQEQPKDIQADDTQIEPLRLTGKLNLILLLGVVLCVALLDPSKQFPGTEWSAPKFLREGLMFGLAGMSYFLTAFTPKGLRERCSFDFFAINEVACLFIGIFITMQVPLAILNGGAGAQLGVDSSMKFFFATGGLSAFLDNAPTYVVFFELAKSLDPSITVPLGSMLEMPAVGGTVASSISEALLAAISCGAVFMGALTYIGNGPNFLVKAIAEQAGVRMPSFFGYMKYSVLILGPILAVTAAIFFV
jgi:Na+/H+ antiporter NhaD/arsenite permease-like protein